MRSSIVIHVVGAAALLLALAPAALADNPLGLNDSDSLYTQKKAPATKPSWLPFNLFRSNNTAKSTASTVVPPSTAPSMFDRVGATFAKMNADTKRAMTRTATTLGLRKKPVTTSSPYGTWPPAGSSTKSKPKKKSSGFGSWFVKPAPRPSSTFDDFFKQPRPGAESGF